MVIDYISMEPNIPWTSAHWSSITKYASSEVPAPRTHIRIDSPNFMGLQHALIGPSGMRLMFCPAKVQGRWNLHGSADLRAEVLECVPILLETMGYPVSREVTKALIQGDYRLREVHIAEQFKLGDGIGISDFINRCRSLMAEYTNILPMPRGSGFVVDPQNRRCEKVVYNKAVEFERRGAPRYSERIVASDGLKKVGMSIDCATDAYIATQGPRLETRFGDKFFTAGASLSRGSAWTATTTEEIFRAELESIRFPKALNVVWARRRALRMLNTAQLQTFLLWSYGEASAGVVGSAKTFERHQQAIWHLLGIDIRVPAVQVLDGAFLVDAAKVFAWSNRVDPKSIDLDRDLAWTPIEARLYG